MDENNQIEISKKELIFEPDSTDYLVKKRRNWVLKQYLDCRMHQDIYEEWKGLFPGLSYHSFTLDVNHAYKTLDANMDSDEEIIAKHIALYYEIARQHKTDNPKIAMEAMKNIERLKKLHAPQIAVQVNNVGTNASLENYSLEQIKDLLNGTENQTE